MPHYWLMGTGLVRHRQDYHGLDAKQNDWPTDEKIFPENFLSWRAVPENFDVKELLEFNLKVYGSQKQQTQLTNEVSNYLVTQEHKVIFWEERWEGISQVVNNGKSQVWH